MNKNLHDIIKFLNNVFTNLNLLTSKRNRSLNFKDIIYALSYKVFNNKSFSNCSSNFKCKEIINVSDTAIKKKRTNINIDYFKELNDKLNNFIYKKFNKKRIIAVDGSKVNLLSVLGNNNDYKLSKNGNYSTALISSLYDIENKIPINYEIFDKFNERESLQTQLKNVRKGDILIMDRGYYSAQLLNSLKMKGISFIFRMKKNSKFITELNKENKFDYNTHFIYNENKFKIRIIKYSINNQSYYLATDILNKNKDINYFKDLYNKRWNIETDFKYNKLYLSMEKLSSKNISNIKKEVYVHYFIMTLSSYLEYIILQDNNYERNKKINKKNSLSIFSDELLYLLFYKKMGKKIKNRIIYLLGYIYCK